MQDHKAYDETGPPHKNSRDNGYDQTCHQENDVEKRKTKPGTEGGLIHIRKIGKSAEI